MRIKLQKETTKWTSDTHFGHNKPFIYENRGLDGIQEHDDVIFYNINQKVASDDILIHAGDFCLNSTEGDLDNYLSCINCQNIYYLWGNHNSQVSKKYQDAQETTEEGFKRYRNLVFCGDYLEVQIDKQLIIVSHYPFISWNKMKKGSWMLHGHEHCSYEGSSPNCKDGKRLDIGIDQMLEPFSFGDIERIMNKKNIISVGDHH